MENLKCEISRKQLIIERNGGKFGTRGTTVHVFRVLFMPDCLSLICFLWHFEIFVVSSDVSVLRM